LIYGYALMRLTQEIDTTQDGPVNFDMVENLKSELGDLVVETLVGKVTDVATDVLSSVIPFAGTAIKIL